MEIKLFDSELKLMEILWNAKVNVAESNAVSNADGKNETGITAKQIADIAKESIGWSKTTTYTIIKKCIDKNAVERVEPNFICRPIITKEQAQQYETNELIDKLYDGKADRLVASLLDSQKLSADEIDNLKQLINSLK